jgi:hypothetical protein
VADRRVAAGLLDAADHPDEFVRAQRLAAFLAEHRGVAEIVPVDRAWEGIAGRSEAACLRVAGLLCQWEPFLRNPLPRAVAKAVPRLDAELRPPAPLRVELAQREMSDASGALDAPPDVRPGH